MPLLVKNDPGPQAIGLNIGREGLKLIRWHQGKQLGGRIDFQMRPPIETLVAGDQFAHDRPPSVPRSVNWRPRQFRDRIASRCYLTAPRTRAEGLPDWRPIPCRTCAR